VKVWELESGRQLHHFTVAGNHSMRGVAISPDGAKLFAVRSGQGGIHCWSLPEGQALSRVLLDQAPHREAPHMTWSPDCRFILSPVWDGAGDFIAWDSATGEVVKTFRGHRSPPNEIVMSADGQQLLSCAPDNSVRVWDWQSGEEVLSLDDRVGVECVAFSPDGAHFLTGWQDGAVRLHETASGKEMASFEGHSGKVRDVVFSPTGLHAASAGEDHAARLWTLPLGKDGDSTIAAPAVNN
jgi:WD40 repeat protein